LRGREAARIGNGVDDGNNQIEEAGRAEDHNQAEYLEEEEEEEDPSLVGLTRKEKQREIRKRRDRERAKTFAAAPLHKENTLKKDSKVKLKETIPLIVRNEWEELVGRPIRINAQEQENDLEGSLVVQARPSIEKFVAWALSQKTITEKEVEGVLHCSTRDAFAILEKLEHTQLISGIFVENQGYDEKVFLIMREEFSINVTNYVKRK